jgi:hypothetical protein
MPFLSFVVFLGISREADEAVVAIIVDSFQFKQGPFSIGFSASLSRLSLGLNKYCSTEWPLCGPLQTRLAASLLVTLCNRSFFHVGRSRLFLIRFTTRNTSNRFFRSRMCRGRLLSYSMQRKSRHFGPLISLFVLCTTTDTAPTTVLICEQARKRAGGKRAKRSKLHYVQPEKAANRMVQGDDIVDGLEECVLLNCADRILCLLYPRWFPCVSLV